MTTKRTAGQCSTECMAWRTTHRLAVNNHLPDCPSLYPAQQEPDALTRLTRLIRRAWLLTPNATNRISADDFEAQALALISEAGRSRGGPK